MTLSSEEHGPRRLVDLAGMAEEQGFDFVSISDHFHPWIEAQGHAPFVWGVLGGIAERTEDIDVAIGVTCPIMRIHPAVLAQATATASELLEGRFTWGVGTGEALNEHVVGEKWPTAPVRLEMLEEAVAVIRELWSGEQVSHRGTYYTVENARIFDAPKRPIPVVVSAFGERSTELAARIGDGLWITSSDTSGIQRYRDDGGTGPVYAQITLCWAADDEAALDTVAAVWPNTAVPGQLSQDLPTMKHFEQATELVTRDMLRSSTLHGPDVQPIVEAIDSAIAAGVTHLYLHQIGADQEGFLRAWREEIAPSLQVS